MIEDINEQISVPEQECSEPHIPNAKTRKALENIKKGKNSVRCKDVKDLLKKLGL